MIEHDILNTGEEDTREQGDLFVLLSKRPLGELWTEMNTPRPVDFRAVRLVCSIFFLGYLLATFLRTNAETPIEVVAMRLSVLAYAGLGVFLGRPQTTWRMLRIYVLILAVGVPLVTSYLSSTQSDPNTVLSLTSLVTFASLLFVLTPVDLSVVGVVLGSFFMTMVWSQASPVPPIAATVVLIGTLGAGMSLSFVLAMYRAEMNERVGWWRASCGRERALREFAEIATAQGRGLDVLLDSFVEIFGGDAPDARAVLAMRSGGRHDVVASSRFDETQPAPSHFSDLPLELQSCAIAAERTLEPIVSHVDASSRRDRRRDPRWPSSGTYLALPIAIDGNVSGVVLLARASAESIGGEDLRLLRAVAIQLGMALGRDDLVGQLRAALSAKGEFVNTMSHELRSPLNVIIGYADMLSEGAISADVVAERIRSSGLELLQLVENTMAVAQMGTGKLGLRLETFCLRDLGAELAEHVQVLPEAKGKPPVQWKVASNLPEVCLDRLKVKEVLQNLVSNGLKYSDGEPVSVAMTFEEGEVRIDVADRGKGIPVEAQARIFEMFERVDRDRMTATPGVGLGLYIVKNLVELLRGRIELSSAPGVGTRFVIYLPSTLQDPADALPTLDSARAA